MPASRVVLLDTNALMMPFQFSINIDEELGRLLGLFEIRIPSKVFHELKALAKSNPTAKSAMALLRARRWPVDEVEGSGDEAVVNHAVKARAIVVTNDAELRRALRLNGVPTIYLRSRRKLEFDEGRGESRS